MSNDEMKYEVGYRKPPKHTQFKKGGRSPNPSGRPKGARGFKTELMEELSERVTIREGGKTRKISKGRAIIKRRVNQALDGQDRAAERILNEAARLDEQVVAGKTAPSSEEDNAILHALSARFAAEFKKESE